MAAIPPQDEFSDVVSRQARGANPCPSVSNHVGHVTYCRAQRGSKFYFGNARAVGYNYRILAAKKQKKKHSNGQKTKCLGTYTGLSLFSEKNYGGWCAFLHGSRERRLGHFDEIQAGRSNYDGNDIIISKCRGQSEKLINVVLLTECNVQSADNTGIRKPMTSAASPSTGVIGISH
jgi:hypothetical protein